MLRETLDELNRNLVTFWVRNRQRDSLELVRGFLEKILAPKQERTMNVPQRNRKRGQDMEL